jgi:hypothetical protein
MRSGPNASTSPLVRVVFPVPLSPAMASMMGRTPSRPALRWSARRTLISLSDIA